MDKLVLTIFVTLTLTACATVKPSHMLDGKQVYEAKCNGTARTIGDCHKLASKQCDGKFDVVETSHSGHLVHRNMLFTCR
jgi:hypothetical protein